MVFETGGAISNLILQFSVPRQIACGIDAHSVRAGTVHFRHSIVIPVPAGIGGAFGDRGTTIGLEADSRFRDRTYDGTRQMWLCAR